MRKGGLEDVGEAPANGGASGSQACFQKWVVGAEPEGNGPNTPSEHRLLETLQNSEFTYLYSQSTSLAQLQSRVRSALPGH